jgi:hypothetical protein
MAKKAAKKSTKKPMPPWLAKKMSKGNLVKGKKKTKAKGNPFAKKNKKEDLKESTDITSFITAISHKNYAQANKYLRDIIESKIQQRISSSLNEPLF